jgi:proline iminopeptidase
MYPRQFYPPIDPRDSGYLAVSEGHRIHWQVSGNPRGLAALYLQGGPGGACQRNHARLFNPHLYRAVLSDQRGCGRSTPHAGIAGNTTADLIGDIEALREALHIDRWLVVGGSWGSALGIAYAQRHPRRVSALVLHGIFLGRSCELDWLYRRGAAPLFPDAWERFTSWIPAAERDDVVLAYHRELNAGDALQQEVAALRWCEWEASLTRRITSSATPDLARARISAHYFTHRSFLGEGQLLRDLPALRSIPCTLIQGRDDLVTPLRSACDLHAAWPGSTLDIVDGAEHGTAEGGIVDRLIRAIDRHAHTHA